MQQVNECEPYENGAISITESLKTEKVGSSHWMVPSLSDFTIYEL